MPGKKTPKSVGRAYVGFWFHCSPNPIFDGDHLIVSRGLPARPGHVVVACLNGDIFVKRLAQEQGQFILRSENSAYSPRYILENDELMIWGVVTHSLRNHLSHG